MIPQPRPVEYTSNLLTAGDVELGIYASLAFDLGLTHGRERPGDPMGAFPLMNEVVGHFGVDHFRAYHRRELHKVYLSGHVIARQNVLTMEREKR